jgi:hypothetical protein
VFPAKVGSVIQAVASGQTKTGGLAVRPAEVATAPFVVRLRLDDPTVAHFDLIPYSFSKAEGGYT